MGSVFNDGGGLQQPTMPSPPTTADSKPFPQHQVANAQLQPDSAPNTLSGVAESQAIRSGHKGSNYNNRRSRSNAESKTSRYRGVQWDRNGCRWRARLHTDRTRHIGYFENEEDAAMAWDLAVLRYFGVVDGKRKLNFGEQSIARYQQEPNAQLAGINSRLTTKNDDNSIPSKAYRGVQKQDTDSFRAVVSKNRVNVTVGVFPTAEAAARAYDCAAIEAMGWGALTNFPLSDYQTDAFGRATLRQSDQDPQPHNHHHTQQPPYPSGLSTHAIGALQPPPQQQQNQNLNQAVSSIPPIRQLSLPTAPLRSASFSSADFGKSTTAFAVANNRPASMSNLHQLAAVAQQAGWNTAPNSLGYVSARPITTSSFAAVPPHHQSQLTFQAFPPLSSALQQQFHHHRHQEQHQKQQQQQTHSIIPPGLQRVPPPQQQVITAPGPASTAVGDLWIGMMKHGHHNHTESDGNNINNNSINTSGGKRGRPVLEEEEHRKEEAVTMDSTGQGAPLPPPKPSPAKINDSGNNDNNNHQHNNNNNNGDVDGKEIDDEDDEQDVQERPAKTRSRSQSKGSLGAVAGGLHCDNEVAKRSPSRDILTATVSKGIPLSDENKDNGNTNGRGAMKEAADDPDAPPQANHPLIAGVHKNSATGQYQAALFINLGSFPTHDDAVKAYDRASLMASGFGAHTHYSLPQAVSRSATAVNNAVHPQLVPADGMTGASIQFKGVIRRGTTYLSSLDIGGKAYELGPFATELEAAQAYDKYSFMIHGVNAQTNFPLWEYLASQSEVAAIVDALGVVAASYNTNVTRDNGNNINDGGGIALGHHTINNMINQNHIHHNANTSVGAINNNSVNGVGPPLTSITTAPSAPPLTSHHLGGASGGVMYQSHLSHLPHLPSSINFDSTNGQPSMPSLAPLPQIVGSNGGLPLLSPIMRVSSDLERLQSQLNELQAQAMMHQHQQQQQQHYLSNATTHPPPAQLATHHQQQHQQQLTSTANVMYHHPPQNHPHHHSLVRVPTANTALPSYAPAPATVTVTTSAPPAQLPMPTSVPIHHPVTANTNDINTVNHSNYNNNNNNNHGMNQSTTSFENSHDQSLQMVQTISAPAPPRVMGYHQTTTSDPSLNRTASAAAGAMAAAAALDIHLAGATTIAAMTTTSAEPTVMAPIQGPGNSQFQITHPSNTADTTVVQRHLNSTPQNTVSSEGGGGGPDNINTNNKTTTAMPATAVEAATTAAANAAAIAATLAGQSVVG